MADVDTADWRCSSCGETVPGNFDVCWKCLTTRTGERTRDGQSPAIEVEEGGAEPDPPAAAGGVDVPVAENVERPCCESCGSPEIVPDATLMRPGDLADGAWHVRATADPAALPVKGFVFGEVTAVVCGECGHIGLRLANPGRFYKLVKKQSSTMTTSAKASDQQLETIACSRCGMLKEKGAVTCPHCGVAEDRDF